MDYSNPRRWPVSLLIALRQLVVDRLRNNPEDERERAELMRINEDIDRMRSAEPER